MTIVDVCNKALSRIGVARIVALTEGSATARAVSACFPSVPDSLLASYAWAFAIWREVLYYAQPHVVDSGVAAWGYELPVDCLSVAFEAGQGSVAGRMESGLFVTEQEPPLNLRYVAQITDPSEWPPAFCEVLAWRIAIEVQPELAPAFAESRLQAGLAEALRTARRTGAIESSEVTLADGLWLISRR